MSNEWSHVGRTIKKQIRTSAPPSLAFRAWSEPDELARFFVDAAEGTVEPGGTYTWRWETFDFTVPCHVYEVVPGSRIVMGEGLDAQRPHILEVTVEQDGGDTVVTLINSGFSEDAAFDDEFEGIDSGWTRVLAIMKHYLENHFGKDRGLFTSLRMGEIDLDAVAPWYRDAHRLGEWLLEDGDPTVDGSFTATLKGGRKWSGNLLTQTRRDSTFTWDEIDGILELTAFKMGPSAGICVRGHGWGLDADTTAKIEAELGAATDVLLSKLA